MSWKKLLWYKQPYPDNYTHRHFLVQLKRNTTVVKYPLHQLIFDFSLISLHISNIMTVIIVFYGTYRLHWNPIGPTLISTFLTIIAFIIYSVTLKMRQNKELIDLQRKKLTQLYNGIIPDESSEGLKLKAIDPPSTWRTFKSSLLILFFLLTLSPVLKSLANSTSSDSIWALSTWLCLLNVLFNDFKIDFTDKHEKESNLSQNISLSNAIVLASRLDSNLSAFCFILFSIQISGLFPKFNNFTRQCNFTNFHLFQLFSMVFIVDYLIYLIFGLNWLLLWAICHLFITIGGPLYFLKLQKYKEELQGPWDPAKPVVNSSPSFL